MPPYKKLIYGFSAIVATAGAVNSSPSVRAQTTAYVVTELSADDSAQIPCRLNNVGDVVGRAASSEGAHTQATVWNQAKLVKKHLGALAGGDYSSGNGINDTGEVAGAANVSKSIVPLVWTAAGGVQRLPMLPGDNGGQAFAINKYGHVVGYSSGPNGRKAFLWTRSAGVHNLSVLPGSNTSSACGINDLDEVAGISTSKACPRAVLWTKYGNVRDLGTLLGDTSSQATAINNNGNVIGYSKGPRGMRAFLWTQASGMQDIGVLPGGTSSQAFSINDLGDVVGSSTSSAGDRAFIWTKQAGMRDLNSAVPVNLGAVLVEAHAINARGQILAMGQSASGSTMNDAMSSEHNEVCAPAPPSSYLLTAVSTP